MQGWPIQGGLLVVGVMLAALVGPTGLSAGESESPPYDIFLEQDTVKLWIDLTPALTQPLLEDLLSGLQITIQIELALRSPRTILWDAPILKRGDRLVLSHPLSDDYYAIEFLATTNRLRRFSDQPSMSAYLADSVDIPIALTDSLDERTKYKLSLAISCKSRTNSELDGSSGVDTSATEAFESALRSFLDVIGFGESVIKIESPMFTLSSLRRNGR